MGKKRPTTGLVSIDKLFVDEDWGDDEWERWRKEMYPDAPNDLESYLESLDLRRKKKNAVERVEETSKAIDEWSRAHMARLAPGFAKLGMTCEDVAGWLRELLDFEDRAVEVMLPALLETLRGGQQPHKVDALNIIADMLDPDKPGRWKLELRRNVRGAPSEQRGSYYHWIALEYFELFEELKERGVRSPAKEAKRRLFKQWKWLSENEFRTSVQWWRKRKGVAREALRYELTGVPTSTWYDLQAKGLAPKPIHLGTRSRGWLISELEDWVQRCAAERDAGRP
jgi:prophage regulatory protein